MSERIKSVGYPLITLALILGIWVFASVGRHVPDYLLPSPAAVLSALYQGYVVGTMWPHLGYTLESTVIGYVIGCGIAIVMGALLAESITFERFVYPYIVAVQSMPKVALAPLIIVWLGFGLLSKVIMVALVCFFPLFVNTLTGIRQTDPELIDLMRAFSGSRVRTFFKVKLPSAAGHIFAGLQISVALGLIGAVVAEFVASTQGLGYLIKAASVTLQVNVMFAALLSLAVIGTVGTNLVHLLGRYVIFWERESRARSIAQPTGALSEPVVATS
jgi:NitT/TauT family transport system permease protein